MRIQLTDYKGNPSLTVDAIEIPELPGFCVHNTLKSFGSDPMFIDRNSWTVSHIATGCAIRGRQFSDADSAVKASIAFLGAKSPAAVRMAIFRAKQAIGKNRKAGKP